MNYFSVSTMSLLAGDVMAQANDGRTVASITRDMNNLNAVLVRYTDGTWFHCGPRDFHHVARA